MDIELENAKQELQNVINNKCTFNELIEKSKNIDEIVQKILNDKLIT